MNYIWSGLEKNGIKTYIIIFIRVVYEHDVAYNIMLLTYIYRI